MKSPLPPAALVATTLVVASHAAFANDSTAQLGAGGLQLVRNDKIAIVSEDLYVSADAVRVAYRFRNKTDSTLRCIVAFPLPAIDAIVPEGTNFVLPDGGAANFVDFTVTVHGTPAMPILEERATALGVDRSDVLRAMGLPLNPIADGLYQTLDALPADTIAELNRKVRVSYILTTANNWSGPIGKFRLVVDKGDSDAIVSFCGENVRKISPTEFEMTADYVPLRELDILIARPRRR
jgi:hypothetical protein